MNQDTAWANDSLGVHTFILESTTTEDLRDLRKVKMNLKAPTRVRTKWTLIDLWDVSNIQAGYHCICYAITDNNEFLVFDLLYQLGVELHGFVEGVLVVLVPIDMKVPLNNNNLSIP
jgi:hypothetical protein